jgi:omega-amidase
MNIVGVQMDTVWEDKAANHAKLAALLAAHPPEPGSLVVLPEMWATGFSMNVAAITETPERETERFFAVLAARYEIGLLGGMVTTGPDGLGRNEAVLFGLDGCETARYTKMHPFSFGTETRYYGRGSEVVLFEWQGFMVAPFICYDLRFPEVFRHAARHGAEVFCVLANWPEAREAHWRALLEARAIENQAYVLGVNRCGKDPNVAYSGHSLLFGPRGELLVDGGRDEVLLSTHLDKSALRIYRRDFPALADIHPDYQV